jgi:NTE family protein
MKGRAVLSGLALGISTTLSLASPAHESALPVDCPVTVASGAPAVRAPRMANTTVAIALGSGSMHGFAHIGVLEELEARGFDARIVTGTSAGALVGSLYASGLSGTQIESLMHETDWEGERRLVLSRQALFSNDPLRAKLSEIFAGRPIESWPRRFGAVATNVADGSRRLLTTGDGALAVQASTAMPVVFGSVRVGSEQLVDGALVEPNPVQAARDLGADFVLAVDVAYRPYEESPDGMSDLAFQSLHILVNALGARELQEADAAVRLDVHAVFTKCGADGAVAEGREAVRNAWPEILGAMMLRNERRAAR